MLNKLDEVVVPPESERTSVTMGGRTVPKWPSYYPEDLVLYAQGAEPIEATVTQDPREDMTWYRVEGPPPCLMIHIDFWSGERVKDRWVPVLCLTNLTR
jgi:hypothetical protein